MSYYIDNNKQSFLDQFTQAQAALSQQVKGKTTLTNQRVEELERICAQEKRKIHEDCDNKIYQKEVSLLNSIRDYHAKATSSIVDMQPYLLRESDLWEAPILLEQVPLWMQDSNQIPTLKQVNDQAQKRTYLSQVLVGYQKYKYGNKHLILPTYVDWQSQDPRMSANTGNLIITYNRQKSSVQALNLADSMVTRMLMAFPVGNLRLSILDPTSMGEERFTKMMNGCDELYSKKVYTNSSEIGKHLEILTNRIRDIKSNFSRTETSLVLHNKQAIKQGYELVILYDPFNERPHYTAHLKNLMANGISAGIYVLIIQSDHLKSEVVKDFEFDSFSGAIEVNEEQIIVHKSSIKWTGTGFEGRDLDVCDCLPTIASKSELIDPIDLTDENSLAYEFYAALTKGWQRATKSLTTKRWEDWVEPYDEADIQCLTKGIEIPVGINADNKDEVCFRVEGGNTYAHSFVQGMTGSGKSKFLSGVISSIAMKYSPKAVQMYLFDFKDGKAFECYMGVPHMRWLVTTQADKTMFLSVLKDLVAEQKYRSELFSSAKVGELEAYNKKMLEQGKECLPRLLLVVDECQDIYKSTKNSLNSKQREINQIFEEIAKKYRAFGIHLLLASQQIPSDMTWVGQLGNNYILSIGSSTSFSSLLPADQKGKADEIQNRILAMPAATGIYSTANKAYISMLGYENYREAGRFIRTRAEKLLGNEINRFESKVWDGKLNVPYFKTMTTASLEFGTNTIGSQTVGTFIEDKKKGNVLLYGSLGADRAKELTMRTVLTTLRGQFATRKINPNPNIWPTIYIVNAWENSDDVVTNIWQQATENVLDKSNKILRNLDQNNFVNLVTPEKLGELLLQLKKQIENKEQKTILLYIIGTSDIEVLKPGVAIADSTATKQEPAAKSAAIYGNWAQSSAQPTYGARQQEIGTDVLAMILQEGPNNGIHTILQVDTKNDMGERGIRSKDFQYFIFQQSKSFGSWSDNVTLDLDSTLEDLPIDQENARTLFYDSKNADEEQFVIPLMIDELIAAENRGESVGEYIINNINTPNYGK